MDKDSKFKFILFIIIILVFIIGGFVLMQKSINDDSNKPIKKEKITEKKKEIKEIRIDSQKDYIYFSDTESIVDDLGIVYETININFSDTTNIASKLNEENNKYKSSVVYDKDSKEHLYNNVTNAKYMKYDLYYYSNYISLVVGYYSFSIKTDVELLDTSSYVFNKENGKLFTVEELMQIFNITKEDINSKIKSHLEDINVLSKDSPVNIEDTISLINEYTLFVDKLGRLSMSYLVKNEKNSYNDIIVLS